MPVEQILANDCNLDIKNPNGRKDFEHLPPGQLVEDILDTQQRIANLMVDIRTLLEKNNLSRVILPSWSQVKLGNVLTYIDQFVGLDDEVEYTRSQ